MKLTSLTVAILFFLVSPASVLAEEQVAFENFSGTVVSQAEAYTPANSPVSRQMHDTGMMRRGKGHQGGGHGGMKHGGGQHGKGKHEKHEQVLQRLDMIEARMAKIEAMLESLMRR